jgi:hypothetical protein
MMSYICLVYGRGIRFTAGSTAVPAAAGRLPGGADQTFQIAEGELKRAYLCRHALWGCWSLLISISAFSKKDGNKTIESRFQA